MKYMGLFLALLALPVVALGNAKPCCCWLGRFIPCGQEKASTLKSCCTHDGKNRHAGTAQKDSAASGVSLREAGSDGCKCPTLAQSETPDTLVSPRGIEDAPIAPVLPSARIDLAYALDLNQVWLQHPFDPGQWQLPLFLRYQSIRI